MSAKLRDVAERAGVSVATASRVLSGAAEGVRPERREAVILAARELQYVPNAHAQALARAGTTHIGAILHDVSDPYFSEILRGLQRAAVDAGQLVTVCNSYRDPERELAYVGLLRSQRIGALILTGSGLDDRSYSERLAAQINAFASTGGRPVFSGRHHVAGDAVLPDNVGGARALARALVTMGHRKFAAISGPPLLTTTRDRLDGFRAGLAEHGITLDPAAIAPGDFTREGGMAGMAHLLDAGHAGGNIASGAAGGDIASDAAGGDIAYGAAGGDIAYGAAGGHIAYGAAGGHIAYDAAGGGIASGAAGGGIASGATCVFAFNDAMALGALRTLRDRGIDVPGRVSLAGFDDIPATLDTNPTLTTVRIPLAEMGELAVSLALEPPSDELRVRHIRAEVVLRESTIAPQPLSR
jgi:LacI family transcriptional regulator